MQEKYEKLYPLIIIKDRYMGVYSGGKYTAWNCELLELPSAIDDSDVPCRDFWDHQHPVCGVGDTPDQAVESLIKNLREFCKDVNLQLGE